MGYSSGRGNRGTRRHARGADVGSDDRRGYSSLVGGSRRDGYQEADSYGAGSYGGRRDYGQPDGYGQPGQYGQPGRHATSPGRALSADLDFGDEAGRGGR